MCHSRACATVLMSQPCCRRSLTWDPPRVVGTVAGWLQSAVVSVEARKGLYLPALGMKHEPPTLVSVGAGASFLSDAVSAQASTGMQLTRVAVSWAPTPHTGLTLNARCRYTMVGNWMHYAYSCLRRLFVHRANALDLCLCTGSSFAIPWCC